MQIFGSEKIVLKELLIMFGSMKRTGRFFSIVFRMTCMCISEMQIEKVKDMGMKCIY